MTEHKISLMIIRRKKSEKQIYFYYIFINKWMIVNGNNVYLHLQ